MNRFTGAAKILRFNWPWYAASLAALGGFLAVRGRLPAGLPALLAGAAASAAIFWPLASLAVSHYVYDRSPLSRGAWLRRADPAAARRVAIFHAGLDEASPEAARRLPESRLRVFDIQGIGKVTSSLARARAAGASPGEAASQDRIPLEDGAVDLALLVFAAHEIRRAETREAFFRELARVLAPAGRMILVEHLRDGWNLLAYGPGAFHFLPRGAWARAFAAARLAVRHEEACTPFVRVFELERAAAAAGLESA